MLMKHPTLLALSLTPILVTVVLIALLAVGSAWLVGQLIADAISREFRLLAEIFTFILAMLIGYFLYLHVARVLLAPFSEALSRQAHTINMGGLRYQSSQGWVRAM